MFSPIRKYQQGGSNQEQLMQQIAQMLQQQIPPQKIMQQLQQMGIQPQQAQQLIQQVAQSMQEQPQMQQGGEFDAPDYNPYLSEEMMKGGVHRMPDGSMMQRMQSGGKLNPADFPPNRTIEKREELYKGANKDIIVYQDTYADGRKDITYQNKKTGQLYANPWAMNKDSTVNRNVTGSLDIQNPTFKPVQPVAKMKKGGMKKY